MVLRVVEGFEEYPMRLEELLPAGTEAEWTCGHRGGAVCAQCHYELQRRANELAAELEHVLNEVNRMRRELREGFR